MLRRQKSGEFHNYPEHRGVMRRLLWRLGFDPLTVYERLAQVRHERDYYAELSKEVQHRLLVASFERDVATAELNPRPRASSEPDGGRFGGTGRAW